MDDDEMEYTLWNKREVMIYQIPPASSSSGHKADDWKDCIWRGSCRVVGKGKDLFIKMIDSSTGNLFAQCTIPNGEHDKYVDRVTDSSRYFVLKITNGQRHAFIGLGFEDRNDAFDFNCTLSDFKTTWVDREAPQEQQYTAPAKDLSLKEGQKIKISFKGMGSKGDGERKPAPGTQAPVGGGGFGILAPPPGSGGMSRRHAAAAPVVLAPAVVAPVSSLVPSAQDDFFGDFKDFQSAGAAPQASGYALSIGGGYGSGAAPALVAAQAPATTPAAVRPTAPAPQSCQREDLSAQLGSLNLGGPVAQVPPAQSTLAPQPPASQQAPPATSGSLDPFSFAGFGTGQASTAGPPKKSNDPFDEFDIFK